MKCAWKVSNWKVANYGKKGTAIPAEKIFLECHYLKRARPRESKHLLKKLNKIKKYFSQQISIASSSSDFKFK